MTHKYPPPFLRRIQTKLLLPTVAATIIIAGIASFSTYGFVADRTLRLLRNDASTIAGAVQKVVRADTADMLSGHSQKTPEIVGRIIYKDRVDGVYIVDGKGAIIYSSFDESEKNELTDGSKLCAYCHAGQNTPVADKSEIQSGNVSGLSMRTLSLLTERSGRRSGSGYHRGILVVDVSTTPGENLLDVLRGRIVVFSILGVLVFFVLLTVVVSRMVTRPVSKIIEGLTAVGAGDMSLRVDVRGTGEMAVLADAFEDMRENLIRYIDDVRAKESHIEELDELRHDLNSRVSELTMLNRIGAAVNSTIEIQELFFVVAGAIGETLGVNGFSLFMFNGKTGVLEMKAASGVPLEDINNVVFRPGEGMVGLVFEAGVPRVVDDVRSEPGFVTFPGVHPDTRSLLVVPLMVRRCVIGVLHVNKTAANAFKENDLPFFTAVANQLAIAIDNAQLYKLQKDLARTDALTGMCNHGCFQIQLENEVARIRRYPQPLALLMLDLDHFKAVNDTYGHKTGDMTLREISRIIQEQTRNVDICARYGGEEFAVILPETAFENAMVVAERIRAAVQAGPVFTAGRGEPVRMTVSVGVAYFKGEGDTKDEFIERADRALYEAKSQGRNLVVGADG